MFAVSRRHFWLAVLAAASLVLAACTQQAGPPPKSEEAKAGETAKEQPVRGSVLNLGGSQPRSFDFQQETFSVVVMSAGPAYTRSSCMSPWTLMIRS